MTMPTDEKTQELPWIESPPILFNTRLFLSRILFSGSIDYKTRRIGINTYLKWGKHIELSEAHTMHFISTRTSIPVPRVQRAWKSSNGCTYICMDVVPGVGLDRAWHDMSPQTKRKVVQQLRAYLSELRALVPAFDAVASVTGSSLRDEPRVGLGPFGPFQSHDAFHTWLRRGFSLENVEKGTLVGLREVFVSHSQKYSTKFTHGDLTPRNIMVKKDGTITAIVDWESAGWYPEYWEYSKAHYSPKMPQDWVDSIGEITGVYDEQLTGEWNTQELFGVEITVTPGFE